MTTNVVLVYKHLFSLLGTALEGNAGEGVLGYLRGQQKENVALTYVNKNKKIIKQNIISNNVKLARNIQNGT